MFIEIKWLIIIVIFIVAFVYSKDDFSSSGIGAGILGFIIMSAATIINLIIYIAFEKIQ